MINYTIHNNRDKGNDENDQKKEQQNMNNFRKNMLIYKHILVLGTERSEGIEMTKYGQRRLKEND